MQTTQTTRNAFSIEGAGFSFKSAQKEIEYEELKKEIEYEELIADNEWVDDDLNTPPKKINKSKASFLSQSLKNIFNNK